MALEDFGRECILREKIRVRDPAGGWEISWKDGEQFTVYMYKSTGAQMKIAEQLGATSSFEGMVDADFPLAYDDYFRDLETGAYFHVTSDPNDDRAPKIASDYLQKKRFTAEKKNPPSEAK